MPIFSGDALGIGVGMDGKDLGMSFRTWRLLSGLASVKPATSAPIRGVTGMTLMVS